jgi:serine/threonine protein phosphatase PrpC
MAEPIADVATAVSLGTRARQEDAVIADFAAGAASGLAVLSDGMGGHDDGDLAARIIVSRVFTALSITGRTAAAGADDLLDRLRHAVRFANESLRAHVEVGAGQEGMGGTVVTAVIQDNALNWISVGDSALYLYRNGGLTRLNEIHSLAPQIDKMVELGEMDRESARSHPQRGCLTSALVGADINRIDCPPVPFPLLPGDIVLLASDGLESLEHDRIAAILHRNRRRSSRRMAQALMEAVALQKAPNQDNASVIVIKPRVPESARPAPRAEFAWSWPSLRDGIGGWRHALAAPLRRGSQP